MDTFNTVYFIGIRRFLNFFRYYTRELTEIIVQNGARITNNVIASLSESGKYCHKMNKNINGLNTSTVKCNT